MTLAGKVAVVTGGGRGIGAAIAEKLAAMGAEVMICGRTRRPLQETEAAIRRSGKKCSAVVCDVSDQQSVESLAAAVKKAHQRCDILVNNAGVRQFGVPLHKMDPADWDRVININLRGVFYCIRAFVPLLGANTHIINISSLAGKNPVPNAAAYSASKWGLNGLSYSVAEELRAQGIRVSVICPGSVDTDLSPHDGKNKSRMLQSGDIAHAVAMLVTQEPQSFISEILVRPTQKP